MNKDLTNELLAGCSPYISRLFYDVINKELHIECADNPDSMNPKKRIKLTGIRKYKEENIDETSDNNLIDSIIGINWIEKSKLCIQTEKKELIIELENEPTLEKIA